MTLSMLALLAGMFGVPVLLLWLAHRLRRRPPLWRAVFWGATAGYVAGMLVSLIAMHYPPSPWDAEGWRTALVHWGMLAGAALGAVVAGVRVLGRQNGGRSTIK